MMASCGVILFSLKNRVHRSYRHWLVVPFLSLPLFVLGTDQMRWTSMIFQSTVVVLAYLLTVPAIAKTKFLQGSRARKWALFVCCLPLLGPLGITSPFPLVEDLLQLASRVGV